MDWKLDSSRPIWPQIEEQIKGMIVSGRFGPGDQFPTVRELAEDARVNPNTMQRALSQLETEGLLVTMRTAGRRVTENVERIESIRKQIVEERVRRFYEEISSLGLTTEQIIEAMGKIEGDRRRGGENDE